MKALQININVPLFIAVKALKPFFGSKVFFRGPARTVKIVDIPEPTLPSKNWVKIKTIYCGFCGSDLNLMRLHDSPTSSPFTSFPCIPGHEIVGRIVEKGEDVPGFNKGDVVTVNPSLCCKVRGIEPQCKPCLSGKPSNCENHGKGNFTPGMFIGINSDLNGGFAGYLVAHESQLHRIPDSLPHESAALTEPVAISLQAVSENLPAKSDKTLVIGGGVIGNLIIQAIRILQPRAEIALIEPSVHVADLAVKNYGVDLIPINEVYKKSSSLTGGTVYKPELGEPLLMGGFNKIYDTVGNSSTLNMSLRLLAAMGTLSVVGIGGDVNLDLTPMWLKLQTMKGVYGYGSVSFEGKNYDVFDLAILLLSTGKIDVKSLITHKYKLDDYKKMIEVNMNKIRYRAIKTLVSF